MERGSSSLETHSHRKRRSCPPYFLCGSVPLWHIHNRVRPATAELSANPLLATSPPMLVYDGSCGFCARSVQFILRHERRHDLLFVPRDSQLGQELRRHFHLEAVESMLWIDGDHVAIGSSAVLNSARYLGGFWAALAAIGSIVPAGDTELGLSFDRTQSEKIDAFGDELLDSYSRTARAILELSLPLL